MDPKELHQEDMDKVAGGAGKEIWLHTIEEIEQSPVFEGLKKTILRIKNNRDLSVQSNMTVLEVRLLAYAQSNGHYKFSRQLCQAFIQKYLPLV